MTVRLCVAATHLAPGALIIEGDDHAYLFRVRRLAVGDDVLLFDGHGREAPATVGEVDSTRAVLDVGTVRAVSRPAPHITVIQSMLKGERMDWCIEKLVEVGADDLILCETERSVIRLDADRRARRLVRHQSIARESSRQSGRADVPTLRTATLTQAISAPEGGQVPGSQVPRTATEFERTATGLYRNDDNPSSPALAASSEAAAVGPVRLIAEPTASLPLLAAVPADAAAVVLLVGPEGGFAVDELERAAAAGFTAVSLGETVLRAETAGAAAVFAIRAARAAAVPPASR